MSKPKSEPDHPRFVSTTGKPELLALLSGHTTSVTDEPEGTPLHPRFHRAAIAQGVVPLAMREATLQANADEQKVNAAHERGAMIVKAIAGMVADATDNEVKRQELFTSDGRPDARAITSRVGFPVNAAERDKAWDEYQDDGEDGDA